MSNFTNSPTMKLKARAVQPGLKRLPNIKNIIAVASTKGGVGKSTTAFNLAVCFQKLGLRTGLLDADVYGPSVPRLVGTEGQQPRAVDREHVQPIMAHGLQTMSIGYLLNDPKTPMVWRGPIVIKALQQLLHQTLWDDLDVLVIDLPPGTGDVQLTMAQKIPVSGAVMITTPQELALQDVRKGIVMFEKVKVPILGVIENMSYHRCTACGHEEHIFGQGGGRMIAQAFDLPLLGELPLDARVQNNADSGQPVVTSDDSALTKSYMTVANEVLGALNARARDWSGMFNVEVLGK